MAESVETIKVESTHVHCDGGGGSLGHPRIYLQIKPDVGEIECPYCSRHYVLTESAKAAASGH